MVELDGGFLLTMTQHLTGQVTNELLNAVDSEMKRSEIVKALELKHREHFYTNFLEPALQSGYIERVQPVNPNSPQQRYRLTKIGVEVKAKQNLRSPIRKNPGK